MDERALIAVLAVWAIWGPAVGYLLGRGKR